MGPESECHDSPTPKPRNTAHPPQRNGGTVLHPQAAFSLLTTNRLPQILPPSPLRQKRMARPLLPNNRRRVRLQNHPRRHRRPPQAHQAAALGHRRHGALPLRLPLLLPRRRRRYPMLRCHFTQLLSSPTTVPQRCARASIPKFNYDIGGKQVRSRKRYPR